MWCNKPTKLNANENESNESFLLNKSLQQKNSNMISSAYEANALTIVPRGPISIERLKVYWILPVLFLEILPVSRGT